VASEGVSGASASVDVQVSSEEVGGHYNETVYGRQFLRLIKLKGMGGAFV